MVTYKDNIDKLEEINPFYRWDTLDRKLQFTKEVRIFTYNIVYSKVAFEQMNFGESVFIPMHLWQWHKVKRFLRKDSTIAIRYTLGDTALRPGGVRVWSLITPPPKIHRPLRIYKIAV